MTLNSIAEMFIGDRNAVDVNQFGCGNINKSYIVRTASENKYVLQRINTEVFNNPLRVMDNILAITRHFERKAISTLCFIKLCKSDANCLCDGYIFYDKINNSYWRCAAYIDAECVEQANTSTETESAGFAFGKFLYDCSDLGIGLLKPTIIDFHCLPKRIERLLFEYKKYTVNQYDKRVKRLINELLSLIGEVNCNLRDGLTDRVTHNDTKISNLLYRKNTAEVIVIDLDTVMAGKVTDDFGDAARSIASCCAEDERNLNKVSFDIDRFSYFTKGYKQGVTDVLSPTEINALKNAPAYVTAELACRFLTDYISGNKYFKIDYEDHNYIRALNQTRLLADIIHKANYISEAVGRYFN